MMTSLLLNGVLNPQDSNDIVTDTTRLALQPKQLKNFHVLGKEEWT